ncbi:MAG: InlB B-repeat-containing protein [Acidimicrobiales bacterium]
MPRLLVAFLAIGASAAEVMFSTGRAGADVAWGTPSEIAASLNTGGDAVINSVSCFSVGNCAAGGYYKDGSGNIQALVVDEVAGTWGTPSEVAGSLNAGGNAWVNSVSCSSVGNCAAGGRYRDSSENYQNFVVDEVAGVWGAAIEVAGPLNAGGHAWVNSVSCTSNGNCAAGGRYEDGSAKYQVFVVDEVAGNWGTAIEVPGSLNTGGDADLNSVSCTSNGNCAAGGRYEESAGNYQAFVVDEVAGVWRAAIEVAGSSFNVGDSAQVFSVSCTANGNCAAGGRYKDGSGYQAFVVDEVGGVWGTASEVAGSLNTGSLARVWSVSCTSNGNCAAGGRYKESSGNSQAFVVDEVGGVWGTPSEVAGPLNIDGDAWINSISCTSDGNCTAGGYYEDGSGNYQAFVVDEVGGVWGTASEVAGSLNAGGDGEINAVSCTSDGNCTIGGYYKDGSGDIQAFVVDEVHAVTFEANGGSGTMSSESSTAGAAQALTANAFTFTGYTFTGWNTAANGSGTAFTDSASYPFNADVTLYAQWSANSEGVSFFANGGRGTMSAESYTTGAAQALTPNAFTFTGHTFTGWNTAANGSGTAYTDRQVISISAAISLFAQWIAKPLPEEIVKAHLSTARRGAQVHLHIHLFGKMGIVPGRVEVSLAGKTICSAKLVDGVAVCSVNSSRLGSGSHRLFAKYDASGLYRSRSKSIVVRVG